MRLGRGERVVLDPMSASRDATRAARRVSTAGCRYISVTPGAGRTAPSRSRAGSRRACTRSGRGTRRLLRRRGGGTGSRSSALGRSRRHAQRQPEVDRELEVHVEELGAQLQRAHVAVEVRHVEAPEDRPLDLGPALLAHLVEVGVVPDVVDRAREAAVAVEQARRVRDRTPAVGLPLGVQREVHADVFAAVHRGGVARPRARHHQRGASSPRRRGAPRRPRRWPSATSRGRRS